MIAIRDFIKAISPPWLIGPGKPGVPLPSGAGVGERYMYSIGLAADLLGEKILSAVKFKFPGYLGFSSLEAIGADRAIARGLGEPDVSYATRLRAWLTTWRYAGSARGVIESVASYLIQTKPAIGSVLEGAGQSVWDELAEGAAYDSAPTTTHVTPKNWTWDSLGWVRRRWLIIRDRNDATSTAWATSTKQFGDGTMVGDATISMGFNQPSATFQAIRDMVDVWKGAGTRYWWVIVNFIPGDFVSTLAPGSSHLPNVTLENWSRIDIVAFRGLRTPSRLDTARYF